MIHKLSGLVLGLMVALITMMTAEAVGNRVHGSNLTTDASATVAVAQQPVSLLLFGVAGWFLAGLLGGMTAVRVSRMRSMAWIVAAAIVVGIVIRFLWAPHPSWMLIAGPIAPFLGAALAQFVGKRRLAVERQVTEHGDMPH
jgi:hypothetical protein